MTTKKYDWLTDTPSTAEICAALRDELGVEPGQPTETESLTPATPRPRACPRCGSHACYGDCYFGGERDA